MGLESGEIGGAGSGGRRGFRGGGTGGGLSDEDAELAGIAGVTAAVGLASLLFDYWKALDRGICGPCAAVDVPSGRATTGGREWTFWSRREGDSEDFRGFLKA